MPHSFGMVAVGFDFVVQIMSDTCRASGVGTHESIGRRAARAESEQV